MPADTIMPMTDLDASSQAAPQPAQSPAQPSTDYDSIAQQFGGQAQSSAAASGSATDQYDQLAQQFGGQASSAPQPGLLSQIATGINNFGVGVGKGAMETATGAANLVYGGAAKLLGRGGVVAPAQEAATQMTRPQGTMQSLGKGAEDIAEFVLGDEALKGLSLGDKLLKVGKVADMYESASPFVRATIDHAITAARTGAVAGGVTLAKTNNPSKALVAGASTAALTPVGELATALSGKAINTGRQVFNDVMTMPAETQSAIKAGLLDAAQKVAGEAAPEAAPEEGDSIRTMFEGLSDAVEENAKDLYGQIDEATQGQYTNVQDSIRNVDQKLQQIVGTDPDLEERLINQKTALNVKADELVNLAQENGVDPSVADDARAAWRQQSALSDVDNAVKMSTFGDLQHEAEVVDPMKLVNRLQKLADTGRLQEAVGDDVADQMLSSAYENSGDAARSAKARGNVKNIRNLALKGAGVGLGALGIQHTIKSALGMTGK